MSLLEVIQNQRALINTLATKLEQLEVGKGGGGGEGGSATIEDYASGKTYKRNVLVVDTATETVYRVIDEYVSDTVERDCLNQHLKLVGFESQIITVGHDPTQSEIDTMPDNALVAVYSATDKPYIPQESGY